MFTNNIQALHERLSRVHHLDFPDMIPIDNVSFCNLRCSMCSHNGMLRQLGIMNTELFKRIIDEIAAENKHTKIWMTFFGESTLLKDMPDRITYAKAKGCTNIAINTNGVLLNKDICITYIKSGLDFLYVGIDAFNSDTYASLRVGSKSLSSTVENVLRYKTLLDQYGNGKQRVFVQFVAMDENESEQEQFAQFWNDQGIIVKFRPKVSWINLVKEDKNPKIKAEKRFPCPWMIETLCIIHDGRVALCAVDVNCIHTIDNVAFKSIKEVWNTTHKQMRENFFAERNLPEACHSCTDWLGKISVYRK